ncbi:lipid A biosynthesis acyltransferase [Massilia sp. P8910]|uniref:LpxL/LpxP family acyltransferase n=1 Tax=Massilia antarctica TaxID=2765360 RepID=UPI0006BB8DFE|nr:MULTISPECIES: lipid A biosynthesis acyltransferase [Massilia]MCE3606861.1 lipid A biosynthesis acyltransferase [Massilia antarctica]MCY0911889.1 lipid A biosynthesis acyltransferase [Massilia sp. H27-R4]CUI06656.1 Lipid A biosynthesis lauroyl acyltransferase [Janthinobacterium sp. CG23_2]CUU30442.1 Lipid A biosynthesis lauroyl acyltransferase [Janthinobacterium sp. CG23_2]
MKFLLGLMWLMHWLPLPVLGRIGTGMGSLLFMVLRKRREIALTNLRMCMPELTEAQRVVLARQHFQSYSRSVWERAILWWAPKARLQRLIQVEPGVPLAQIAGRPTILLCPHFVCLDVAGMAVMLELNVCSMYVPQKNVVFDEVLRKGRTRFRPVKLFSRKEGVKPIIRAMREHLPYFMLPDMDFGDKDAAFVPFFGIPAATLTAPGRLAAATGAQVIPVVATFLPNYTGWKVTFYPAWEDYPGDDMVESARRMNAFIEERVREAPAEYFWTHKRFKTRPPGEPSPYEKK